MTRDPAAPRQAPPPEAASRPLATETPHQGTGSPTAAGDAGTATGRAGGDSGLERGLRNRQMSMIAIGGVVGAGLFVGSGTVIRSTGPAALVSYAIAGLLVILVMRMLAELAVADPSTGSFAHYASREFGSWCGLAIGWLYAYSWWVTVGLEAVIGGELAHHLVPAVPAWVASLVLLAALTASNLIHVAAFGEAEYWFALIKVVAIVAFIGLGALAVAGLLPGTDSPGAANLLGHGGFAPEGWYAVLPSVLTVIFAFGGAEVVTIAAGEAPRPAEAVRKAIRSTTARILIFYIGSIGVIVTLLPYDEASVTTSPYSAALDALGVPQAGRIMDVIVLIAVASCLNSGLYTASRMLFALAHQREAPRVFARTHARGVPVPAVLVAALAGLLTLASKYFAGTATLFTFLLDSTGAVIVLMYLCVAACQIRSRMRAERHGRTPAVRMWAYPYLSWTVVAALTAVLVLLAFDSTTQRSLFLTLSVTVAAAAVGALRQRRARTGDEAGR
ncbi:amino acid permease [Streptomyces benahoarensis]|uniref:Amino acid permease n=1 Tax=Streptomyces benahoarensis TaxID=2595054 RepID=A0A553ZRL6_9ACTN|nr:amino acid permease [Streptomyces benahoarensis]TSB32724.1 amino acid permease [Streptomyces benahoarensis]TSB44119.1 amino acid permease [Streptomyces benahoarensis]